MNEKVDDFDDDEDIGMSEGWSKVNPSNTELFVGCGMSQKLWHGLDLSDYPISKGDAVKVEDFGGIRKLYINGVHAAIKEGNEDNKLSIEERGKMRIFLSDSVLDGNGQVISYTPTWNSSLYPYEMDAGK